MFGRSAEEVELGVISTDATVAVRIKAVEILHNFPFTHLFYTSSV